MFQSAGGNLTRPVFLENMLIKCVKILKCSYLLILRLEYVPKGGKMQITYKSFKYKEFFITILKIDKNNDSNLKYPVMGIEYTNYNVARC